MAANNYDWADIEKRLRSEAQKYNVAYDPSDLEGIKRHTGYDVGGQSLDQAYNDAVARYQRRGGPANQGDSGAWEAAGSPPPQSVTGSWSQQTQTSQPTQQPTEAPGVPDWYQEMFDTLQGQLASEKAQREAEAAARAQAQQQQEAEAAAAEAARKAQRDQLYAQLQGRAQQSLQVTPTDPVIAAQSQAYSAQQQRARQNYLADLAERSGSLANLQGEERLTSERLGAQTAQFEADLLGRELSARREEIAGSLAQMGGMLSTEQQQALQEELARLDNVIQQRQLDVASRGQDISSINALLQGGLQARGQDIGWQQGLFNNQLQWQIEQLRNEQAMRNLGLQAEDKAAYWDYMRSRA